MKLYRIVKGTPEIVDYDQAVAEKMLKLNPDRYKTIEDFENNFEETTEEKKERRGRKPKNYIENETEE